MEPDDAEEADQGKGRDDAPIGREAPCNLGHGTDDEGGYVYWVRFLFINKWKLNPLLYV